MSSVGYLHSCLTGPGGLQAGYHNACVRQSYLLYTARLGSLRSFDGSPSHMPIKFFWFIRIVPQTPMEDEALLFNAENLKRLLQSPFVLSVGEITRWPELVKGNDKILDVMHFAHGIGKRVDGHTAGAKNENLIAISRAGVDSCHESIDSQGMIERLRLGFHVMLRQSSLRQDLRSLLEGVRKVPLSTRRVMLTTDGCTPAFQLASGMIDNLISIAMEEGIEPVEAYRMATLNPAAYFGLEHRIGGIAPGRDADILILKDLHHPTPETVISRGRLVAQKTILLNSFPHLNWNRFFTGDAQIPRDWRTTADDFRIHVDGKTEGQTLVFPVIKLLNPVITRAEKVEFPVRNGCVDVSAREGFSWVATMCRHGRWVANGVLQGHAHGVEGIASTFNTAAEIVVIGRSPEAMALP